MRIVRVAMWSGPRSISTAMMRAFGSRPDTAVVDEPLYAAYLARTGLQHPMREQVMASQSQDWTKVVHALLGPVPGGKRVYYQKHMTHHLLPDFSGEWTSHLDNVFLIRDPVSVLASYIEKRNEVTLSDIGIEQQRALFEREAQRLGSAPLVIESVDVLRDPAVMLATLCEALAIPFDAAMLSWPAGRRESDGVWAPAWYHAVEESTGFAPYKPEKQVSLPGELQRIADEARPHYERLVSHRLLPARGKA